VQKLTVKEGYEAYAARVSSDASFTSGNTDHALHFVIGGANFDVSQYWGSTTRTFGSAVSGEVAVVGFMFKLWSFTFGVDLFCRLTAEATAKWQISMYDAIIQGYQEQKADYEARLAAADIQGGVRGIGRNPIENRRLERDELKKLIVMMLTGSPNVARDSFEDADEPILNVQKACKNGSWVRFFENAFEWNNLVYVFYPYFWGRKARWLGALSLTDTDLDFAAFLKAGAARVQVPVRPGFERAVAYFSQTGLIWEGNDPPLVDDELYVPIVEEIAENLGKLDVGVPYPPNSVPWEVRVPTSLVVVQDLDEISDIKDVLTGKPIDLD
jgi:hypothetical protein